MGVVISFTLAFNRERKKEEEKIEIHARFEAEKSSLPFNASAKCHTLRTSSHD
jgi:uncharacterized lipoprotein YbaY